jgi:hypothetical protein
VHLGYEVSFGCVVGGGPDDDLLGAAIPEKADAPQASGLERPASSSVEAEAPVGSHSDR